MRVAVTGASGLVGHPVAAALRDAGHRVTALGRAALDVETLPWTLGDTAALHGHDALVHCAFAHLPGRYRGGEGDDPETFRRLNVGGTLRLFDEAKRAGLSRIVFLSTRAVYGAYAPGTALDETLTPRPETLYGEVKLAAERALAALAAPGCATASLRATGVYGPPVPGKGHKWDGLFADFAAGRTIAPRIGTEVHADDLAAAILLLLNAPEQALAPGLFNLSDIRLDRHDLLAQWARTTGIPHAPPPRAGAAQVSEMTTDRIRALGWRPRGPAGVEPVLRAIAADPHARTALS